MRLAPDFSGKRGRTVALLLAVFCALVAYSRVYSSFERVRVKVVEAELVADEDAVSVATPDLSGLEGQATAIIARVRNDTQDPRRFAFMIDGTELASFVVGPGRVARIDRSVADGVELARGERIELRGDGGGWSLEYLEIANVHGHSIGALALVIVPETATVGAGAAGLLALPMLVALFLLSGVSEPLQRRWVRITHLAAGAIVLVFFAAALVAPWVSPFRVLLAPQAFLLLTAVLYLPGLYRVGATTATRTWLALARAGRLIWSAGERAAPRVASWAMRVVEFLRQERTRRRIGYTVVIIAWFLYLWIGVVSTAYTAGGSDSSGYLNTARWLSEGSIIRPITALDRLDMPVEAAGYFRPLGTVPGPEPGTLAPYYPPGLPVHMMVAAWIGGWERFPFLISPLAAAFGLLVMYALAREIGLARLHSVSAAVVLGICPTYLYMAMSPMSDVLATFWAMSSILAALRSRRSGAWAFVAGAVFGIAVTVRPANALMLLPLALALKPTLATWVRFGLGGLPIAAPFFVYNYLAYGDPLTTGYNRHLSNDMRLSNFAPRFRHYSFWIGATLTPLVPLGWFLVIGDRKAKPRLRLMLWVWFLAYFLFYCFYAHYDAWWYTRFLLPGFPALILATMVVLRDLPVPKSPRRRLAALALVVGAIVWVGVANHQRFLTFRVQDGEATYRGVIDWVDENLPEQTAVLSMQTSGAFAYYTDRIVARWDSLDDESLADLRERLDSRGYGLVAALFPFEVDQMKQRFAVRWKEIGTYRSITFWAIDEP